MVQQPEVKKMTPNAEGKPKKPPEQDALGGFGLFAQECLLV
jgi:hypothetical protein